MRTELYSPRLRSELAGYSALEVFRRHAAAADTDDSLALIQYLDIKTYLVGDINTKVDRASMSVSLEVRCPLLDTRLVEFAWSLPLSMRLKGNTGKIVLRKVLERYVPPELTERPKMGFAVPVSDWIKGPLRDWAEHLLNEPHLREQGLLAPKAVRRIWQQHLSGWQDHDTLLWSLLMFQAWHEEFNQ